MNDDNHFRRIPIRYILLYKGKVYNSFQSFVSEYNEDKKQRGSGRADKRTYSINHMRRLFFENKLAGVEILGNAQQNKSVKIKGMIFGSNRLINA